MTFSPPDLHILILIYVSLFFPFFLHPKKRMFIAQLCNLVGRERVLSSSAISYHTPVFKSLQKALRTPKLEERLQVISSSLEQRFRVFQHSGELIGAKGGIGQVRAAHPFEMATILLQFHGVAREGDGTVFDFERASGGLAVGHQHA